MRTMSTREEPRIRPADRRPCYRESPLKNPVNDVRAMAQRFRELGFAVFVHENAAPYAYRVAPVTCPS